jgi:eukaryotic-like serine/threonine-protein kinase
MAEKLWNYEVLERIGEGARSQIYAVKDPVTRKTYALKHVVRNDTKDIRFVEQMETEFEISKSFNHPTLRKNYELKINKNLLLKVTEAFLLMELVEGKTIDHSRPEDMIELIDVFIQVAQGLKHIHEKGYVHCDLKPINIMRTPTGQIKIIDYGQSCRIGTVKERIQGTPDYIAPEQVIRQPVNQQTDVFNLGATMYWATTGRHIPTLYTVNKKGENSFLLDARFESPGQINPNIPHGLTQLIMECVSTRASKRPPDMDAVIQRLELAKYKLQKERNPDAAIRLPTPEDSMHGV